MRALFVIHTPKDPETAIFIGYRARQEYFESQKWVEDILAPEDLPVFQKALKRYIPVLYPFFVARHLFKKLYLYDFILFHSYSGWVFNLIRKLVPGSYACKTVTVFHGLEPLYFTAIRKEMIRQGTNLSLRFRIFYCLFLNWVIRISCRRSDAVFCLNNMEKKYLVENSYQTEDKIRLVANEVDDQFFISRPYAPTAIRLLFVGQWLMMKGLTYLTEAFTKLAREYPDLKLRLVGTLKSAEEVRQSFPSELHSRIEIFPRVTRDIMVRHYAESDIFVQPTLSEGFNRAISEAMAASLPVVTTRTGMFEIIEDGQSGIFIPLYDSEALVAAVRRLIPDQELRRKLGTNAHESIQPFHTIPVLEQWFAVCKDILKNK